MSKEQPALPITLSFWMPNPVKEAISKSKGVPLVRIEESSEKVAFYVNDEHIVTQVK